MMMRESCERETRQEKQLEKVCVGEIENEREKDRKKERETVEVG